MQLIIIRHGQSEADLLDVHEGRADFPLTKLGEEQAIKMAKYIAHNYSPEIILASPLKRASKTAQILQQETNVELYYLEELMEFNNGVLAGMKRDDAAKKYPIPLGGRPVHEKIENGESELEFYYRANYTFHKIMYDYSQYKRIAIVSHGGFISNFIKAFLEHPNLNTAFATGDTGIHLLEIKDNRKVIRFMNKQEHLFNY